MSDNEEALIKRAKRGERDAFVQLLSQCGPDVRQSVQGSIGQRYQALLSADDVMQQAYTDAFLGIQNFNYDGPGSFTRWLNTLARRNCVDGLRALQAAKRGGQHDRVETQEDSIGSLLDLVTGFSATPSRFAAGDEARRALQNAVSQLPAVYRHVIRRLDLEGTGVSTVAEEIGRTIGAVYMVRARAHERLAEIMGSASRYLSDGA